MICNDLRLRGEIAIVGGGPAGLILARLLQQRGFKVRVYERDASPSARKQGGSLDLHTDSGQLALREAGLLEAFMRAARVAGQAFKVLSSHGQLRFELKAEDQGTEKPEIDRGDLRQLLLDSLEPGTVIWDHNVEQITAQPDGRHQLLFTSPTVGATIVTADLVVGADGVRSKVRALLSPLRPSYVGLTMIETLVDQDLWRGSPLADLVGEGAVLITGGGKGAWIQRNSNGAIRLYYSLPVSETWPEHGVEWRDKTAMLGAIAAKYTDWSPELMAMLTRVEGDFYRWPLYCLPPDHSWSTKAGLTILGDAAHVMPPFTGKGANMALLDALELADSLCKDPQARVTTAISAFEKGMQSRMGPAVRACLERMELNYGITTSLDSSSAQHRPSAAVSQGREQPLAN